MARALTPTELGYIRSDGQSSELYMWPMKPATIYTARINQTFATKDRVIEITYDGGSGTLADVLVGMTMYVGTAAGLSDAGMVRIRKVPDATKFYIGENSDVVWDDDLYLTVVDTFSIWPRHVNIIKSGGTYIPYMDWDVAYSDQHSDASPIPCIGPRLVPVWLDESDPYAETLVPFDASLSTVLGSTITGYSWVAPGASSTADMATATPTIGYDTAGVYRVACTVTAANGKTTTAYAYVGVFTRTTAPPVTQFDMQDCAGSRSDGGWKAHVKMWDEANFDSIVDRAQVVLFSRDFYGTTEASIGPIADRENIVMIGWIDGESIDWDPDGSSVVFTIETAHAWLKRTAGFPIGIRNSTNVAAAWTEWQALTVDKSLYHLLYWQSTVIPVIDVFLTGDTRYSYEQYAQGDTVVHEQLILLLKNTIMGSHGSDRFNRFFCEVDPQITPVASRSTIPEVMELTTDDWRDKMRVTRTPVSVTSLINLSGVVINPAASPPDNALPVFSLAPGHVYERWGRPARQDRLLLADQSSANTLAAMKLAWDNHTYEFEMDLAGNNRMVDVFPAAQFVTLNVAAEDTPREFVFSGHAIIREVHFSLSSEGDTDANFLQVSWKAENETFPGNSCNGDIPETAPVPEFPPLPPLPDFPPLPPPPFTPPDPAGLGYCVVLLKDYGVFYTSNLSADDPNWLAMNSGLPTPSGNTIRSLQITASGKLYCCDLTKVYYAPAVGSAWTEVFDATTDVGNPDGFPFPQAYQVEAIGAAPDEDDNVLIVASGVFSIFTITICYSFVGTGGSGFTLSGDTGSGTGLTDPNTSSRGMMLEYQGNSWTLTLCPDVNNTRVVRLSGIGDSPTNNHVFTGRAYMEQSHKPAVDVGSLVKLGTTNMGVTVDGALIWDQVTNIPANMYGEGAWTWETLACNYLGTKILAGCSDSLGLRRSSDSGATWGQTLVAGSVTSVFFMGDDAATNPSSPTEYWIVAKQGDIGITADFGDSFRRVTGDLYLYATVLFRVRLLRTFNPPST